MEWTGQQQMVLALQSAGLGLLLGFLFDVLNGFSRLLKRSARIWIDIIWGPISALIVFFGSLVISDGQLHPTFLLGAAVGMLTEHYIVGIWISKMIVFCCLIMRKWIAFVVRIGRYIVCFFSLSYGSDALNHEKVKKKPRKRINFLYIFKKHLNFLVQ